VGSTVLSIAQMGATVCVGLLLDTLIVRALLMPSLVALLGRWFWWPTRVTAPRVLRQIPATPPSRVRQCASPEEV
jgi:RND superfamily putative drug exporter